MKFECLLVALTLFALSRKSLGDTTAFRKDLEILKEIPCHAPTSYQFWDVGVLDSQVLVALYQYKEPLKLRAIQALAKQQMTTEHHRGFYFAKCSDTQFYIITTPSPVEPSSPDLEGTLKQQCISYQIDRAQRTGLSERISLPLKRLKGASSTVICKLVNSNQEWFLFPPLDIEYSRSPLNLVDWLNQQRRSHILPDLKEHPSLRQIAQNLLINLKPLHNRSEIEKSFKLLIKQPDFSGARFIMEDRVSGKTLGEVQDLLWWSPKHRDLILNPKVNRLGIAQYQTNNQFSYSIVVTD